MLSELNMISIQKDENIFVYTFDNGSLENVITTIREQLLDPEFPLFEDVAEVLIEKAKKVCTLDDE